MARRRATGGKPVQARSFVNFHFLESGMGISGLKGLENWERNGRKREEGEASSGGEGRFDS